MDINANHSSIVGLYLAGADRVADQAGLNFWNARQDDGIARDSIAQAMFNAPELQAIYPDSMTDQAFVEAMYKNTLGRATDPEGLAFWTGQLANHVARSSIMLGIVDCASVVTNGVPNEAYFYNRLQSAQYALTQQLAQGSQISTEHLAQVLAAVNADPASVSAAQVAIDQYSGAQVSLSVIDGPVQLAKIYRDDNGNGVWDANDTLLGTSDEHGDATVSNTHGKRLLAVGGTDIDTNKENTTTLSSHGGPTTPFSTLADVMSQDDMTPQQINQATGELTGQPDIDAASDDPYVIVNDTSLPAPIRLDALHRQSIAWQIINQTSLIREIVAGASHDPSNSANALTPEAANHAAMLALVQKLKPLAAPPDQAHPAPASTFNLADQANIQALFDATIAQLSPAQQATVHANLNSDPTLASDFNSLLSAGQARLAALSSSADSSFSSANPHAQFDEVQKIMQGPVLDAFANTDGRPHARPSGLDLLIAQAGANGSNVAVPDPAGAVVTPDPGPANGDAGAGAGKAIDDSTHPVKEGDNLIVLHADSPGTKVDGGPGFTTLRPWGTQGDLQNISLHNIDAIELGPLTIDGVTSDPDFNLTLSTAKIIDMAGQHKFGNAKSLEIDGTVDDTVNLTDGDWILQDQQDQQDLGSLQTRRFTFTLEGTKAPPVQYLDYMEARPADTGHPVLLHIAADIPTTFSSIARTVDADNDPLSGAESGGNESLSGDDRDNTITVSQHNNLLDGGAGNDTLKGGTDRDTLRGGAGDDHLTSDQGGLSRMEGGSGNDVLRYGNDDSDSNGIFSAIVFDDSQRMSPLPGKLSADVINAGPFLVSPPTLNGGAGDDILVSDTLAFMNGGAGNDLFYAHGRAQIDGGSGTNTLAIVDTDATLTDLDFINIQAIDLGILDDDATGRTLDLALADLQSDFMNSADDTLSINIIGRAIDTLNLVNTEWNVDPDNPHLYHSRGKASIDLTVDTLVQTRLAPPQDGFTGTDGPDKLHVGALHTSLDGGLGNDTLTGGNAPESKDTLLGGAGDDRIIVGAGSHSIDGGAGDDTIIINGDPTALTVNGGDGFDTLVLSSPKVNLTEFTFSGIEAIELGRHELKSHDVALTLTLENVREMAGLKSASLAVKADGLAPLQGVVLQHHHLSPMPNLTINGDSGDTVYLDGNDWRFTGEFDPKGNLLYTENGSTDPVVLGIASDIAVVPTSTNVQQVGDDNAALDASAGSSDQTLLGDARSNILIGGSGNDILFGRAGNDTLKDGGGGDNTLNGGDGNDILWTTGNGANFMIGGDGSDTLRADGNGANSLFGGAGNDIIYAGGEAQVDGGDGIDTLILNQPRNDFGGLSISNIDVIYLEESEAEAPPKSPDNTLQTARAHYTYHLSYDLAQQVLGDSPDNTLTIIGDATDALALPGEQWTPQVAKEPGLIFIGSSDSTDVKLTLHVLGIDPDNIKLEGITGFTTDFADMLRGTDFDDVLIATGGANISHTLIGGLGNDILQAGEHGGELDGGAGNDVLYADANATATVDGDAGNDSIRIEGGRPGAGLNIDGGSGNDTLSLELDDFTGGKTTINATINRAGGPSVQHIEQIDMSNANNHVALTLSLADLRTNQANDNTLTIDGRSIDSLTLDDKGGWLPGAQIDGYQLFDEANPASAGSAQHLKVANSIATTITGNDGSIGFFGPSSKHIVKGGNGDDLFQINFKDYGFVANIDGGAGNDILRLVGSAADGGQAHVELDKPIQSIETLDLVTGDAGTIATLPLDTLIAMLDIQDDGTKSLTINGDSKDTIVLDDAWDKVMLIRTVNDVQTANDSYVAYEHYEHLVDGDLDLLLLVGVNIHVEFTPAASEGPMLLVRAALA